ncbi:putative E3 ubiquitin-protein ligase ARI13 [Raphanus sativus]|uniref:Probable E3 ubiquitin-protein ligase ARI13 n=1 Tax=Raphanus sativus TaxID=3726 RepID=A0A9W3CVI7_RAPSA|nr:probable E3 ubiquitin-protein ligase ARI13 [Raphanus sativus]KAJ4868619.1 putative E3 ubiquitin-protein ligase ARI13 [Raphanus sativus]
MEHDLQRDYSVLTKDDLKEKMNKQIDDLSEIFLLSKADATVLLTKLQWDSQHVSERLSENKEKFLMGLGFSPAVTESNYGDTFFSVQKNLARLTLEAKDMYEEYVLRSYLEENKCSVIKQCPSPGCSYFIEFHRDTDVEEYGLNVVCLCGHTFCGRCSLESHRPVTCNIASDWLRDLEKLSELSRKSLTLSWIESNTKRCPHCQTSIEISTHSRAFRFVGCLYCSGRFCWECMQPAESHRTQGANADCVVPYLPPLVNGPAAVVTCVERWEASEIALVEAKSELESFDESQFTSQEYIRIIREGLMLIVQCRQFLKWSCAYDHIHNEYQASKREYLRFLQDCANTLVQSYSETLKEEAVKAFSATTYEETVISRGKVCNATSNIGNYFFHFTKTLQGGIDDVKVKSYDNFGGPYWLCDRCTCGNTWLDMTCKMCCAKATPVEKKLRDLSLD